MEQKKQEAVHAALRLAADRLEASAQQMAAMLTRVLIEKSKKILPARTPTPLSPAFDASETGPLHAGTWAHLDIVETQE
jgi:hypothetical protein